MRVCFTSDLHGDRGLYEQLGECLVRESIELLILGGDLFADVDRDQPVWPQVERMTADLLARIDGWRVQIPALAVACIGGNHEIAAMRTAFVPHHRNGRVVLLDHRRAWLCGGVSWLGYSFTPPTPHWAKDYERLDCSGDAVPDFPGVVWDEARGVLAPVETEAHFRGRSSIEEDLVASPRTDGATALVAHAPPHDSGLDQLPQIAGPLGSRGVRRFIAERQPAFSLHGHFHDSHRVTGAITSRIGSTLCINPGQGADRLHAAVFDVRDMAGSLRHTVLS